MRDQIVTVFGGSGFLGRHVVRALAKAGWRIRVAVRRPDLAGHLQPMGRVGQIHAFSANLRVRSSVIAAARNSDAIVNLVGILAPRGRQTFEAVHGFGAGAVAAAARETGARLVHVSAIGADPNSPGAYGRSKAAGEAAVREAVPEAFILRPSIVFGPEDQFFNRFAAMARIAPVLPLVGGATRFQPVFAGDIGEAVARIVDGAGRPGTTYEFGGPETRSMEEILRYVLAVTGRRRPLLPVPFPVARALGSVLELLPGAPLTADQVRMLESDNLVSPDAAAEGRTLEGLGIEPTAIETVVPSYLWRFRRTGQFERERIA